MRWIWKTGVSSAMVMVPMSVKARRRMAASRNRDYRRGVIADAERGPATP